MTDASPTAAASSLITLAGGCFWCTEAVFLEVEGVTAVESGYRNGHVPHPSYEQVCSGTTGHAEVVRVRFDPARVSLRDLLEIFFVVHDPTTLNRQGNDRGSQYRSAIFAHDAAQLDVAREGVAELQASGGQAGPIVTELDMERDYSPAEAYHRRYFEQHPGQGYCAFVVAPKVEKFRKTFARLKRVR